MRDADPPMPDDRLVSSDPERLVRALQAHSSPGAALGAALAALVRDLLRGEFEERTIATEADHRSPWMTPPAAARLTSVPVKTIRAWVRMGRIPKRIKNRAADPKQVKYLVNVNDVVAVAERRRTSLP